MIKMKKILFAFAAMIVLVSCGNKQTAAPAEGDKASNEVAFEMAKNPNMTGDRIRFMLDDGTPFPMLKRWKK